MGEYTPEGLGFGKEGGYAKCCVWCGGSEILCVTGECGVLGRTPPSTVKRENQIPQV